MIASRLPFARNSGRRLESNGDFPGSPAPIRTKRVAARQCNARLVRAFFFGMSATMFCNSHENHSRSHCSFFWGVSISFDTRTLVVVVVKRTTRRTRTRKKERMENFQSRWYFRKCYYCSKKTNGKLRQTHLILPAWSTRIFIFFLFFVFRPLRSSSMSLSWLLCVCGRLLHITMRPRTFLVLDSSGGVQYCSTPLVLYYRSYCTNNNMINTIISGSTRWKTLDTKTYIQQPKINISTSTHLFQTWWMSYIELIVYWLRVSIELWC